MPETIFDGRLRGSGQTVDDAARYTSSVPLRHRARTRNEVPDTGRVILAPAPRTALAATLRVSVGTPPHFGRQKRQCRRRLRRAPRPLRLTTLAPEPPTMPTDTSVRQSVGASTDGTDSSPCTTVCARGRDCSTQTPWRLRPSGFASVDSPIAFHEILVLLYALRRVKSSHRNAPMVQSLRRLRLRTMVYDPARYSTTWGDRRIADRVYALEQYTDNRSPAQAGVRLSCTDTRLVAPGCGPHCGALR